MSSPVRIQPTNRRLTSQDASFIYGESFSGPMHIANLAVVDGEVDVPRLSKLIDERLHLIPRYRQRLAFVPWNLNHALWVDDQEFDVANHVVAHDLPRGATIDDACRAAIERFERPLDRRRPLWEVHLFAGIPGVTVMLISAHHCLVDGASGTELLTVLFDLTGEPREVSPPEEPWDPGPPPSLPALVAEAMRDTIATQAEAARRAARLLDPGGGAAQSRIASLMQSVLDMASRPIAVAPWNQGTVTSRRRFARLRYPFTEVREIRAALGGTVNDVVLAVLSEGVARYLRGRGFAQPRLSMRIGCPVNVRTEEEVGGMGNRVSMMFVTLPATPLPPRERLAAVSAETARCKEAGEAQAMYELMDLAESVPPTITGLAALNAQAALDASAALAGLLPIALSQPVSLPGFGVNFVATNVPGVQVPLYVAGCRLTEMYGLVPLSGNLGFGVAIFSYDGAISFGLLAEPRLLPDLNRLRDHVAAAFSALLESARGSPAPPRATGGPALTRAALYEQARTHRIPGRSRMNKAELAAAVEAATR